MCVLYRLEVKVFWVVTAYCCGRLPTFWRTLLHEVGSSKVLWNIGILLQQYMVSQCKNFNLNLHSCENLKSCLLYRHSCTCNYRTSEKSGTLGTYTECVLFT